MSEKCPACFRPLSSCYCKYIEKITTDVHFVFLMHPKEAYHQKTGTGRLAHLTLTDSEIIIGIDFTNNTKVKELLSSSDYFPLLLYPDKKAWTATSINEENLTLKEKKGNRKLLVFVIDATWFFAKKILRLSPNIYNLPKISFEGKYLSQFEFKTQPAPECVSTIESCYYLLNELAAAKVIVPVNTAPLMNIFKRMVKFQIESQKQREINGEPDRYAASYRLRAKRKNSPVDNTL